MSGAKRYPRNLPTDELICLPYLDTGSAGEVRVADAELRERGLRPWQVRALRAMAAPGLWHQLFDWEWGSVGAWDVLLGYGVLLLAASPFAGVLAGPGWGSATLLVGLALLVIGLAGLRVRRHRRQA